MNARASLKSFIKALPGVMWLFRLLRPSAPPKPLDEEGPEGVRQLGHRVYVGGLWDEIGKLQFDFLMEQGLQPHHYLLDIACGSLRAGIHFIPYLEASHYLGVEKEEALLQAGIDGELGADLYAEKRPQLVVSKDFAFQNFSARPHFALAHSLFTHVPVPLIGKCFSRLRSFIRDDGVFYATFTEAMTEVLNPSQPHDHANFQYTKGQMERIAGEHGWKPYYIGGWNHPRNSKMMKFYPA